jgi:hypothetical protein
MADKQALSGPNTCIVADELHIVDTSGIFYVKKDGYLVTVFMRGIEDGDGFELEYEDKDAARAMFQLILEAMQAR